MKKNVLISLILVFTVALTVFCSCSNKTELEFTTEQNENVTTADKVSVNVGVLKGPTGMGVAYMWQDANAGKTANNYNFSLETDASVMASKVVSGEYDIVAIPTNAAATLYNKSQGKIQIIAVNTMGVLHIVAKDGVTVNSVADLKGKTVLSSGQGAVPEYALNYILEQNGLKVGIDVTIDYATEHSEVVAKALKGEADIVLLPEPFVTQLTIKDTSFKEVLDLTEEWDKISESELAMGCFVVNKAFADKNADAVRTFIDEYNKSQTAVNSNPDESSAVIENFDILSAAVAKSAIPNSNIVCLSGEDMKNTLNGFFEVIYNANNASIGGKMPDDGIWFE